MNNPTSTLEEAQRRIGASGKGGAMVTTVRRCVSVLALVLLFLVVGVVSVSSREARAQESLTLDPIRVDYGVTLPIMGDPALAETLELEGAAQERIEARARFKTH